MWGAIIGAGASLIGGALNRREQRKGQERTDTYNDPKQIRSRYEAAGFNPLLGIANASPMQQPWGGTPQMGTAIANAGLAYASGMQDKRALDIEKSRLEMDRQKLDLLMQKAELKPKVGGLYAGSTPLASKPVRGVAMDKALFTTLNHWKTEDEADRYDVKEGGSPAEQHAYERQLPGGVTYYTERPGMGQRVEDEAGDLLAAPMMGPYVTSDAYHNARGDVYDGVEQKWKRGTGLRSLFADPLRIKQYGEKTPAQKKEAERLEKLREEGRRIQRAKNQRNKP